MQFKEETESAFRNFNSLKEENEKLKNQLNMANKQLKVTVGMLRNVKPYFGGTWIRQPHRIYALPSSANIIVKRNINKQGKKVKKERFGKLQIKII